MVVEITEEMGQAVNRGGMHCQLITDGWDYSENDDGVGVYSKGEYFEAREMCLEDAYKLNQIIKSWGLQS